MKISRQLQLALLGLVASAAICGGARAQTPEAAAPKVNFYIKQQPMGAALTAFGEQSGLTVIVESKLGRGLTSQPLSGLYTADEALRRILEPAGLIAEYLDSKTVLIRPAGSRTSANNPRADGREEQQTARMMQAAVAEQQHRTSSSANSSRTAMQAQSADFADDKTEEILVTAQKRSERLQEVPMAVTAISAERLVDSNRLRLQDYYSSIPGMSIEPRIQGIQTLSLRGSAATAANPTVGVTVDDVPYGASTSLGGGNQVPDLDPSDLARIEVLRGPQGTLYGANSMGGVMKFVTVDPSPDRFGGRVEAGTNSVRNGAQLGYNVRASINVPVAATLALRLSGFTREDPAYIDNPVRGIEGINAARYSGGHLSALWKPSDAFSLKVGALYQEIKGDGSNDVDIQPGLGDLQQNRLPGIGAYYKENQAYSAVANIRLGAGDLTSVSGYTITTLHDSFDYSWALSSLANSTFGVTGAPVFDDFRTTKYSQELRFSVPLAQKLELLAGAFYTHEDSPAEQNLLAMNPATGAILGNALHLDFPTTLAEYAGFADLTYHFTDRFDVQVGGRKSFVRQTSSQLQTIGSGAPVISPEVSTKDDAFTYLVTPRFRMTPELMVYARLASGYSVGGPNVVPGGVTPALYSPARSQNYELGLKGDFLDQRFAVDLALYSIDWKDLQLGSINPQTRLSYTFNGGRAKTQGAELSVEMKPVRDLRVAAWVTLTDAVLTEPLPSNSSVPGAEGDRLPFTSRFSGNFAVDQEFALWSGARGFAGATLSYVGDRIGRFGTLAAPRRQELPAYAQTDFRVGARFDEWQLNMFLTNAFDKRGIITGGLGYNPPYGFAYVRPRTLGLTLSRRF